MAAGRRPASRWPPSPRRRPSSARPPRDVPSATWRLIIGLALMFTLAPATRFGYFMYPLGLWAWLAVSVLGGNRPVAGTDREPSAPVLAGGGQAGGGQAGGD